MLKDLSRRRFFQMLIAAPVAFAVALRLGWPEAAFAAAPKKPAKAPVAKPGPNGGKFTPTPECADSDEPTPSETAGPFYKTKSPRRTSLLEPGMKGTPVVVSGRVFSNGCEPVANAQIEFWQADDDGEYDNEGYRLRGHQFTDATGRYRVETIVPGLYGGRTRHIHVRVQAANRKILTTQLYFPDEPQNESDFLFRPELLMKLEPATKGKAGRFHFMLDHA